MKEHPIERRIGEPKPIAYPLDIECMVEAHGRLYGYLNAKGTISIRPCDRCLDERLEEFKAAMREVVSA